MESRAPLAPYSSVHAYGLGDLLHEQARGRPNMTAVIDREHLFTYAQLDERVNRLAGVLRGRGVGKGDRVLWLGQNSFRIIEALLACARVGAVFCPANWRWSVDEIIFALEDFQPKLVFWQTAEVGESIGAARSKWQPGSNWICHDDHHDGAPYEALLAASDPESEFAAVEPSTPLLAIYTAGFSGRPAAALLSHEAILIMGWLAMMGQLIDENSGYLVAGPMFHIGTLMGAFGILLAGGRNAFLTRMDAEELLQTIASHKLTHGYIPQPSIEPMRVANSDGRYDVTSMFADNKMSNYKHTMQTPDNAPMWLKPGGYGQTEIGGFAAMPWLGGTGAGRAAPFIQLKIADHEGNELPAGQTGEIFARGPLVMCGYWNRAEENARRVINGWHRTNDLGRRTEDGSMQFIGPKSKLIKTGLENVYPAEVERCLMSHEGVLEVCVIGVPDATWDQNVKAVIVRKPGTDHSEDSFIAHCRKQLASYKKPKIVEFTASLPKTAAGLVDREAVDTAFGGGGYPKQL